jgi:hypothetical protein
MQFVEFSGGHCSEIGIKFTSLLCKIDRFILVKRFLLSEKKYS